MFYIYSISQKLKNIKWRTIGIGSKEFGMSRSLPPRKKEFKILAWNRLSLEASTRRTVRPCSMNFNSTVGTVFTPCAPPFQLNAVAFDPSSKNYAPLEIRELHWLFFLNLEEFIGFLKKKKRRSFSSHVWPPVRKQLLPRQGLAFPWRSNLIADAMLAAPFSQ